MTETCGGGGVIGNGNPESSDHFCTGGSAFIRGGMGGNAAAPGTSEVLRRELCLEIAGGFGGGGGSGYDLGSGGGGYTGGDGATTSRTDFSLIASSGGTSFAADPDATNRVRMEVGHGSLSITPLR